MFTATGADQWKRRSQWWKLFRLRPLQQILLDRDQLETPQLLVSQREIVRLRDLWQSVSIPIELGRTSIGAYIVETLRL